MTEKTLRHPYDRYSPTAPIDRPVPEGPWLRLALVSALLVFALTLGWELVVRSWGYGPSYNDTADLWAIERDKVAPDSLVVIGASRALFDLDPDVFARDLGRRPIFLASVGSTTRPVLHDLAQDPDFRGDVIYSVTPPLVYAPGGPTLEAAIKRIDYRRDRTLSQRAGHWIARRLEEHLAFLKEDRWTLKQLLLDIQLPYRAGAIVFPREPPYFAVMHLDRTFDMLPWVQEDKAFGDRIRNGWIALLSAAPPMKPEQVVANRDAVVAATKADIDAIRARGGRVVFVRPPSTGPFLEFENKVTPKAEFWDPLLARTGSPGVYFSDHPELAGFDCPEWSHLTPADAALFTERLIPHLRPYLRP